MRLLHFTGLHTLLLSGCDTFNLVYRILFLNKLSVIKQNIPNNDILLFFSNNKLVNYSIFDDITCQPLQFFLQSRYPSPAVATINQEFSTNFFSKLKLNTTLIGGFCQGGFLNLTDLNSFYTVATFLQLQQSISFTSVRRSQIF
jgi:hypothetical protein